MLHQQVAHGVASAHHPAPLAQVASPAARINSQKLRRHWHTRCGVSQASKNNSHGPGGDSTWTLHGFPSYLQSTKKKPFPCADTPLKNSPSKWQREEEIWQQIRQQAQLDAAAEPLLSSFLYASILAHDSFPKALAFVLANRLANTTLLPTQLFEIFVDVLQKDDDVRCGALADVEAVHDRDPACLSLLQPLLYMKGFQAIQTHRIAHALWTRGQRVMALALQSRSSELYAVDIHPAARIGKGILLDHGTGVVIGETAVLGDNCSLLQNITLGGTGKETGDRHPKIGDNVLIGANATVLGNIRIGAGAQIAAGSLVLKPVDPCTMVAGSPAQEVGKVQGNPALTMSHWYQDGQCSDDKDGTKTAAPEKADVAAATPQNGAKGHAANSKQAAAAASKNGAAAAHAPRTSGLAPLLPGEGI